MEPEPNSASKVAEQSFSDDKNFLIEKIKEFAMFKKQLFSRMGKRKKQSKNFSLLVADAQNNADTLYFDILSVYGAIVDEEANN